LQRILKGHGDAQEDNNREQERVFIDLLLSSKPITDADLNAVNFSTLLKPADLTGLLKKHNLTQKEL
jgi:hypothetical protein